jgi:hypothetical protein
MIRYVKSGGVETITEVCEHCGEVARTLHVSDITAKSERWTGEIKMKDASNADFTLKTKRQRIAEVTESFIRKGLLDEVEAAEQKQGLKYGLRAESMCSESIDTVNNVTQSFCYRVAENPTNSRFAKVVGGKSLSASFADAPPSDTTGSRMGVDRKGNVIKLKEYKKIDMRTGIAEADSLKKYKGAHKTDWFRAVRPAQQKEYIEWMQQCEEFQERYGRDEVKRLTVVNRFRNEDELSAALTSARCR